MDFHHRLLGQLQSRLKKHLRPAFDGIRVADFSTSYVKGYIAKRRSQGASNATVNRELEILERALRLGSQCDPPKVSRVVHVPMLVENNVRTGFLDDEGYLRLKQALPEHLRPIFIVAYHVGNRLGELRSLRWDQVDFRNAQIVLNPGTTKNKKGRTLPIYGEMGEILKMEREVRDAKYPNCHFVFHREGELIGDFRKAWATACKLARVPGLLFHDLRRSAIRNMRLAGVAENVAMTISGHRTRAVFDRYSIVGARDIQQAAEKLDERMKQSLGTILGTVSENGTQAEAGAPHAATHKNLN